jgi:ubiquinone/menaquinone biosynthesis C-methylase UbiE
MAQNKRVIDFGSGFGEALLLWQKAFGISGLGIDIRPAACQRAQDKIATEELADQLEIICGDAAEYAFQSKPYDVATCIGATFIWQGGFQEAVNVMQQAIKPTGRLIIGEAFLRRSSIPAEIPLWMLSFKTEAELLKRAREAELDLVYVLHSSQADWDHYESENWRGMSDWLDENPTHPNRSAVLQHLRDSQTDYVTYGREFLGWALYVFRPGE